MALYILHPSTYMLITHIFVSLAQTSPDFCISPDMYIQLPDMWLSHGHYKFKTTKTKLLIFLLKPVSLFLSITVSCTIHGSIVQAENMAITPGFLSPYSVQEPILLKSCLQNIPRVQPRTSLLPFFLPYLEPTKPSLLNLK